MHAPKRFATWKTCVKSQAIFFFFISLSFEKSFHNNNEQNIIRS